MKCFNCSAEMPENAGVCPRCGADQGFTQELIDRARSNDQLAVTELYNKTYSSVYYTVTALIKDEDASLDIMQDSFIKAFRSLDQLKEAENFKPWVKRIAHNRAIDYLRQRKPVLFCEMSGDDGSDIDFEDTREDNLPEVSADKKETARLLRDILDSLPEEQRAVISMFYYEEMTVKDISRELGVSENTVKSRMSYGRKRIEVKVRELEKKGTKLYGLSPVPFLLLLFRIREKHPAPVPKKVAKRICVAVSEPGNGDKRSGGFAFAESGKKLSDGSLGSGSAKLSVTKKIVAAAAAVCIIAGGATAIGYFTQDAQPVYTASHYSEGDGTPMGMGGELADSDTSTESAEPVYQEEPKQVEPPTTEPERTSDTDTETISYTDPEGIISLELPELWEELLEVDTHTEYNDITEAEGYWISFNFEHTYNGRTFVGTPLDLVIYEDPNYDPGDLNGDEAQVIRAMQTMQTVIARSDRYTVVRQNHNGRGLYYNYSEDDDITQDYYQTQEYYSAQQDYNKLAGDREAVVASVVINDV